MARKKANIHYIYKTTCLVTGRYYIGMHSTFNIEDGYMGSGKRLRHSLRKYGVENHVKEILEYLPSRELLIEREREIITFELIEDDYCMNLVAGGHGGFISVEGYKKGAKIMNEIVNKRKLEDADFFNKWRNATVESLIKRHKDGKIKYDNWSGKKHKIETIELMKQVHKGKGIGNTNSQYGTCWITKDGINKKIKKELMAEYLDEGWEKGRKL